jgi:hypothetical protein
VTKATPDHSNLTRVRDRLPLEVHAAVFQWALRLLAEQGLMPGKTAAIDSTFLEANAAMKSIVRRGTGDDWNEYLRRLMKEREGVEDPTDEDWRRAAELASRVGEGAEALLDRGNGEEPGLADAQGVRHRHAAQTAGRRRP